MSKPRNVSLKDVAALAGVSAMTASRVLANRANVSTARAEAVRSAAAKLGYLPNPMIQRVMSELRRGHSSALSGIIAFLNSSLGETDWRTLPYLRPYLDGARARAESTGFAFDEIWINQPGWSPARTRSVLLARGIHGFLVVPGSDPTQFKFDLSSFAIASFGGLAFDLPVHQVLPDAFHNTATCVRELTALGYRRVGLFIPEYERAVSGDEALGGYLSAQWQLPPANRVAVGAGARNWQVAEDAFKRWVVDQRPDVVIAAYNQADRWLADLGLSIPDHIGLVHPGLAEDVEGWSGIDADLASQGAQAVDLLTAQIFRNEHGLPAQPKRLTIRGRWVPGRTTRPQSPKRSAKKR